MKYDITIYTARHSASSHRQWTLRNPLSIYWLQVPRTGTWEFQPTVLHTQILRTASMYKRVSASNNKDTVLGILICTWKPIPLAPFPRSQKDAQFGAQMVATQQWSQRERLLLRFVLLKPLARFAWALRRYNRLADRIFVICISCQQKSTEYHQQFSKLLRMPVTPQWKKQWKHQSWQFIVQNLIMITPWQRHISAKLLRTTSRKLNPIR